MTYGLVAAVCLFVGAISGSLWAILFRENEISKEVYDLRQGLVDLRNSVNAMRVSIDLKARKPRAKKAKRGRR